ncbi:phage baseplate assembly protein V [Klebsiella oxytoca]|uniref:phage baseplate assembly protein V n=1 Tax=Klebsiella oxytoca TaxID=571 RepID=UPI002247E2FC|nr:phage baseplate assembly protein V [Klebsiella oxytoca]MCW9548008.1 phage baseplate assembly protein V [Klebsiella oxytoca]
MDDILHYLLDLVRVGNVVSTNNDRKSVRVQFPDLDNVVSHDLRMIFRRASKDQDSGGLPDIGDQVVCLYLPSGDETGFVLGSVYSEQDRPPADSGQSKVFHWTAGGASVSLDRESGALVASGVKTASVTATEKIMASAPTVEIIGHAKISGDLDVSGNINAGGSIMDAAGNSNHHSH